REQPQSFRECSGSAEVRPAQGLVRLTSRYEKVNVVVVNAPAVGEKREVEIDAAHLSTGGLEGSQRHPILTVGGVRTFTVFVKPRQRMLCLPLEKDRTELVLLDLAKGFLGLGSIATAGCNLSLDEDGVEFVEMIGTFAGDGKSLVGIVSGLFQVARL